MCHVTQGSQGKGHYCHFRCHFCDDTCTVQMPLKGRILTVKLQPQNAFVCYFQPLQGLLLRWIDRNFILLIHQSYITFISSIVFFKFGPSRPLFLIHFFLIFLSIPQNSILSCYHLLSSHHFAISTPSTISSTMEFYYLQSQNDSLYWRAQKQGVCCWYDF